MAEEQTDSELLPTPHPGDVLLYDWLEPLGKSKYWLAKGLGVSPTAIGDIIAHRRGISPMMALRLEKFLGVSAEFWLRFQASYDLETTRRSLGNELEGIVPLPRPDLDG
jgi:addiction module HigA family antidote